MGYTDDPRSWRNPGKVVSAVEQPPPACAFLSKTVAATPDRAKVIAAANPFGPDPMTQAFGIRKGYAAQKKTAGDCRRP